jgi:3'-phosphoadenosine 5'-phosphosulfate sulfotransferase (PAPS reductase)/FAD synthetase
MKKKWQDENGVWFYTNTRGVTKKLLTNLETGNPYKVNDVIQNDCKFQGRVFSQYRYDRPLSMYDKDYWGVVCKVVANTGKELPETLDFVHECEKMWDIDITWLELQINEETPIWSQKVVDYITASREGEPFDELIIKTQMLPNLYKRICTIELKIKPIERYMQSLGYKEWYSVLGLRYDEPRRVRDSKDGKHRYINICPMYDEQHTNEDVLEFWQKSNFDLHIPTVDGKAAAGNCDLCFLKGTKTTLNLMHEKPDLANWWIEKEVIMERTFRNNRPNYIKLLDLSKEKPKDYIDDETFTCFCHD